MYLETNSPINVGTAGGYGNGFGYGGDWIWVILLFALWGNNGWGGNGGNNTGYELGKLATTNDVASGFSTSTIMSNQRDMQLALSGGFADIQQSLCQGFNGINTSILNSANATERGFATTNYNLATGVNGITTAIDRCCCEQAKIALESRYLNEKQTCDLITNQNANTQRIIDYLSANELAKLRDEKAALTAQLSQISQNAYLVNALRPAPIPSYSVPNPFVSASACGTTF